MQGNPCCKIDAPSDAMPAPSIDLMMIIIMMMIIRPKLQPQTTLVYAASFQPWHMKSTRSVCLALGHTAYSIFLQ